MGTQQLLRLATRRATRWYVDIDQVSRRNAMVASTALAQRRLEYVEVEEFLALHQRRHRATPRRHDSSRRPAHRLTCPSSDLGLTRASRSPQPPRRRGPHHGRRPSRARRASCCAARCRRTTTSSPTISRGRPRSSSTCGRRSSCGTGTRWLISRRGWSTSRCSTRCVPATRARSRSRRSTPSCSRTPRTCWSTSSARSPTPTGPSSSTAPPARTAPASAWRWSCGCSASATTT